MAPQLKSLRGPICGGAFIDKYEIHSETDFKRYRSDFIPDYTLDVFDHWSRSVRIRLRDFASRFSLPLLSTFVRRSFHD